MQTFIRRYADKVTGVLSGFDRLRLRGTYRWLANVSGMRSYLWNVNVLLKDFKTHMQAMTRRLRDGMETVAAAAGLEIVYLTSPSQSKEQLAQDLAAERQVDSGLICVLSSVEPCWTYQIYRNRLTRQLELRSAFRKCLHFYQYLMHPTFGFLHVRLQSWFPFNMHICLNGREWLARQMDAEGLGYLRRDNAIVAVDDPSRAQALLDQQLRIDWPGELDALAAKANPAWPEMFAHSPVHYYWSADQTEWATDVLFRRPQDLATLYPGLLRHAITTFGCRDILRFLGQKVPTQGGIHPLLKAELVSELSQRPEGIRIRHRRNKNSVKMYDKQGSVLRVETTIHDARDLKVYRRKQGDPDGPKAWRRLRKGVADLQRRATLSQKANERYLDALEVAHSGARLREVLDSVSRPVRWKRQRVRGLRSLSVEDRTLLAAVGRAECLIAGLRNRDIRQALYGPDPADRRQARRRSAAVTRKLRMLRAHGILAKIPRARRYRLTPKGRQLIAAIAAAQDANIQTLTDAA
jgi:hypothetical protein